MNKMLKTTVVGFMSVAVLTGVPCLMETKVEAADLQSRVASILNNEEQVKLAFYLDTDGYSNYDQKVIDDVVAAIQTKLPVYAKLAADTQLLGNFDLFREEKQNELLEKMAEENPTAYALMNQQNAGAPVQTMTPTMGPMGMMREMHTAGSYNGTGRAGKMPLSKKLLAEFLSTSSYDGLVIIRIDKVSEHMKANWNPLAMGANFKVEMDVTTRVFNKNSEAGYVFLDRQRVIGKVHGAFDSSIAVKRAVPQAIEKIGQIKVK